jgi:hypothetical protein
MVHIPNLMAESNPTYRPKRRYLSEGRSSERPSIESVLDQLPLPAKSWMESLSWQQRRYVLSLCHLICAAPPNIQAEFLDEYTADGLVSKKLEDQETRQRVQQYLKLFQIENDLSEPVLRSYIRQFYIHSAQDTRCQPDLYLQSALKLVFNTEERRGKNTSVSNGR